MIWKKNLIKIFFLRKSRNERSIAGKRSPNCSPNCSINCSRVSTIQRQSLIVVPFKAHLNIASYHSIVITVFYFVPFLSFFKKNKRKKTSWIPFSNSKIEIEIKTKKKQVINIRWIPYCLFVVDRWG